MLTIKRDQEIVSCTMNYVHLSHNKSKQRPSCFYAFHVSICFARQNTAVTPNLRNMPEN